VAGRQHVDESAGKPENGDDRYDDKPWSCTAMRFFAR
jgi:hypothetical protein